MHSSSMRTARSLTVYHCRSACWGMCMACMPPATHAPCHACPPAMYTPHHTHPLPCMPHCHACPLSHMPPTTHAPTTHAPHHTCPPTTHAPCHACPLAMHAPLPCMPPCHVRPPWKETLTHTTQNITLTQTSFVGGKNSHSRLLFE